MELKANLMLKFSKSDKSLNLEQGLNQITGNHLSTNLDINIPDEILNNSLLNITINNNFAILRTFSNFPIKLEIYKEDSKQENFELKQTTIISIELKNFFKIYFQNIFDENSFLYTEIQKPNEQQSEQNNNKDNDKSLNLSNNENKEAINYNINMESDDENISEFLEQFLLENDFLNSELNEKNGKILTEMLNTQDSTIVNLANNSQNAQSSFILEQCNFNNNDNLPKKKNSAEEPSKLELNSNKSSRLTSPLMVKNELENKKLENELNSVINLKKFTDDVGVRENLRRSDFVIQFSSSSLNLFDVYDIHDNSDKNNDIIDINKNTKNKSSNNNIIVINKSTLEVINNENPLSNTNNGSGINFIFPRRNIIIHDEEDADEDEDEVDIKGRRKRQSHKDKQFLKQIQNENNNSNSNYFYQPLQEEKHKNDFIRGKKRLRKQDIPSSDPKKCPICLEDITTSAYLDKCKHRFCKDCIDQWADVSSSCPICKEEYKKIFYTDNNNTKKHKNFEDGEERFKKIKKKQFVYEDEEVEPWLMNCQESCMVCHLDDNNHLMLVCDRCLYHVCHTYCIGLDRIPDEDWICMRCVEQSNRIKTRYALRNMDNKNDQQHGITADVENLHKIKQNEHNDHHHLLHDKIHNSYKKEENQHKNHHEDADVQMSSREKRFLSREHKLNEQILKEKHEKNQRKTGRVNRNQQPARMLKVNLNERFNNENINNKKERPNSVGRHSLSKVVNERGRTRTRSFYKKYNLRNKH